MADGLELRRYLLNRELEFWRVEGQDRTGDRIFDLPAGSPEADCEHSWQEHCLQRLNPVAWDLEEIEGRGDHHEDAPS